MVAGKSIGSSACRVIASAADSRVGVYAPVTPLL
ncbi:hypothetical protein M2359_002470 [Gordonia amarae]|nr:hypothetical protein [Gordonia amarae]